MRIDPNRGRGGWSIALALLLVGCAHETTPPPVMGESDYRIGAEDVVDVAVWKEPALSATVPVRPDGKISLPMVGEIVARGRTARELEQELQGRLRSVVTAPTVAVMVKEVRAARFFVLGEVVHPGSYPLNGELTVLQALAVAGGPTEFARRRRMVVIRGGAAATTRYKVDYYSVVAGEAPALRLAPGDTVYVP